MSLYCPRPHYRQTLTRPPSRSIYMPDSDSSLERLEESGAPGLPLRVNGCHSIWVLDDDASMLKALGRLLMSAGFSVEKFNHPAAFLSKLKQDGCRVAVLDVWMPDMSGLEVQACLLENSPETRIIFISGRDDAPVRQTALDAGAFGFLSKPFEDEVLVQLIRKAMAP
jgi:FixJ family two-component response regulator